MYKIKQIPEDFFVREIPKYELNEEGGYTYFTLKKKNRTTLSVISEIARKLDILLKRIGFAGTKDKVAVTEQLISIKNVKLPDIGKLNLKNAHLELIGKGETPISLGDLEENYFRIIVRNLPTKRILIKTVKNILNLFGPQRFSEKNIEVGEALLKRNFGKAVELIDHKKVKDYLEINPGDYIGAVRNLPLKLRKFYIHAYQSYIWNLTVEIYIKNKSPIRNEKIPIVGFGTELKNDAVGAIIKQILKKLGISQRDFVLKQFPEISSEGSERDLFITPKDFKVIKIEEDELNPRKFKAMISFSLPSGSYATVVIKELFKK
ncbi:tRNA pseudouridine(13) synthase TruD [Candidatus Woesearchaeota archaeon]|nr:tRNA pseudouridine(13) synthase TruD [Candidatus Woesearchaeota archaeon]